jgi:periplasmic protein CpxP/Spy
MNRLPRIIALTLGLALAGTALAQPQDGTPPPGAGPQQRGGHAPDPQQQLEHLSKQLQLSSDQQAKIGPILQQRAQQVQALRADNSLAPADRRAKMMSLAQATDSQIDAILTPAQRDQLKAIREKQQERMEERRSQPRMPSSGSSSG